MRSEGATQPATKVVITSIMFIAGMISMGGIVGVLNSTVNNLRTSDDYIRTFYSSQVSEKKIPFSSLLKKDFTLEEISVLAGCDEYLESVMPIPSPTDFAHLQATYDLIAGESNAEMRAEITRPQNGERKRFIRQKILQEERDHISRCYRMLQYHRLS